MDQLGIAQYITRVGLRLAVSTCADEAKKSWMETTPGKACAVSSRTAWSSRIRSSRSVVQNVVLDGPPDPLVYQTIVDDVLSAKGGTPVAMLTQFMTIGPPKPGSGPTRPSRSRPPSLPRTRRSSPSGSAPWRDRAAAALLPVARIALGDPAATEPVGEVVQQFNARMAKAGVPL